MNLWRCDYPGCTYEVIGLGSAVGLRAIGWYFMVGPVLFCPRHRPDKVSCADGMSDSSDDCEQCSLCAGEREAALWQWMMKRPAYGFTPA